LNSLLDEAGNNANLINNEASKFGSKDKGPLLTSDDKIMQAAYDVSNAARDASEPRILEQKTLLGIVAALAKEMEALSLAAQNNSKKDMISYARNIAEMISQVQNLAAIIADKCGDKRLKDQLLSISKVPKNFAIQLKIISAVKASSGENDASAKSQLVICAQSLANSVVSTLKAAEAAQLKCT